MATSFTQGTTPGAPSVGIDNIADILLYPGDRVVAVGAATLAKSSNDFAVARYLLGGNEPPTSVVDRSVFYHRSRFAAAGPLAAVPSNKVPLLPGHTAAGVNITDYNRGINGIIVALSGDLGGPITADDFVFKVGTAGSPGSWTAAPAPQAVTLLPAVDGVSRVVITWADGAIKNTWLQVTTLANSDTRLAAPDVFYYGNVVGNAAAPPNRVDMQDLLRTRRSVSPAPVGITDPSDHDHDGRVSALDVAIVRANLLRSIPLLAAPAAAPVSVASISGAPISGATTRDDADRATDLLR